MYGRHDLAVAGLEIGIGKSELVFGFNIERNITACENRSVLFCIYIPFQKREALGKCAGVADRNGDRIAGKANRLATGFAERIGNLEIAIGQVADAGSRYDRIAIDPKSSSNIGLFTERIIGNRPPGCMVCIRLGLQNSTSARMPDQSQSIPLLGTEHRPGVKSGVIGWTTDKRKNHRMTTVNPLVCKVVSCDIGQHRSGRFFFF